MGLSRTSTTSLAKFFGNMNVQVIHFDMDLTPYMPHRNRSIDTYDFRVYDDVDAVFDLPTAFYYRELMEVYPRALFISSYRDPEGWFNSFESYLELMSRRYFSQMQPMHVRFLHCTVYGSAYPNQTLWINNYQKHYHLVSINCFLFIKVRLIINICFDLF